MSDVSEQSSATNEPLATDADSQLAKANKYGFSLWAGSQKVLLDEMMFAGNEIVKRALEETRIFNESISKLRKPIQSRIWGRCIRSAPSISWTSSAAIRNGSLNTVTE